MQRWRGKVAVVTGASAGIGASCVRYLVDNGMVVVGLARRKERVEELRTQLKDSNGAQRLHAKRCDVRNEEEVCRVFAEIEKEIGPIAALVNNAGIVRSTSLLDEKNSSDMHDIVDTNIMGVVYCTREAFRSMKQHGGDGHVIIINSISGHYIPIMPDYSMNIYPATKHAVTAMTEVYRQEMQLLQKTKIKVTSISPGLVSTEIFTPKAKEMLKDMPALNPDDVADTVVYCLQTPPHVQIHELTIKPVGEMF